MKRRSGSLEKAQKHAAAVAASRSEERMGAERRTPVRGRRRERVRRVSFRFKAYTWFLSRDVWILVSNKREMMMVGQPNFASLRGLACRSSRVAATHSLTPTRLSALRSPPSAQRHGFWVNDGPLPAMGANLVQIRSVSIDQSHLTSINRTRSDKVI